jgi:signal transduction histidine kinase
MATELRKTGISVVGDIPWGTHFCHFYETKEDLLDILIPYFKTGLENHEFCVWVVSDPLAEEEAKNAFRQAVPEAGRYLLEGHIEIVSHNTFPSSRQQTSPAGHIEIVPHTEWYLKGGAFIAEKVIDGWNEKLAEAQAKGYAGLRANGNEAWLTEENRKDFIQYEKKLDEELAEKRMIVLCSYPLSGSHAAAIFDVVNTHQLAVLRRRGNWEVIETPEPIHAKAEIKRLNEELKRVLDRTPEPPAILRYGIAVLSVIGVVIIARWMEIGLHSASHVSLFLCAVMLSAWFGGIRPGLLSIALSLLAFDYFFVPPIYSLAVETNEIPRLLIFALSALFVGGLSAAQRSKAASLRRARDVLDGTVQQLKRTNEALRRENAERRRAEEELKATSEQLRKLSASLQSAIEEERIRIARELHDELGSALAVLKWGLEEISALSIAMPTEDIENMREKLATLTTLIDTTFAAVRRISSELRPGVLDEAGLVAAIEWAARQFEARTEIICQFESSVENFNLSREQSTAVFRIFQEALTNILRHAEATTVGITMKDEGSEFVLTISDNGKGITAQQQSGAETLGIIGMRERAHLMRGEVSITRAEGGGTIVTVRVPIAHHEIVRRMTS